MLVSLRKYEKAIEFIDHALEINPHDTENLIAKGIALELFGRHFDAISFYENALKIDKNDSEMFSNIGFQIIHMLHQIYLDTNVLNQYVQQHKLIQSYFLIFSSNQFGKISGFNYFFHNFICSIIYWLNSSSN